MPPVKVYTTAVCPYCVRAKQILKSRGVQAIEEIRVDLPDRDNPMQRRTHVEVAHYVSHLMSLLKLDANADVH